MMHAVVRHDLLECMVVQINIVQAIVYIAQCTGYGSILFFLCQQIHQAGIGLFQLSCFCQLTDLFFIDGLCRKYDRNQITFLISFFFNKRALIPDRYFVFLLIIEQCTLILLCHNTPIAHTLSQCL